VPGAWDLKFNDMDFKKIAIIGVGLIGGSIALAIKEEGFRCRIIGIGRSEERLVKAKKKGIIDEYSTVPSDGVEDADLIILSTPVGKFEGIMSAIRAKIKSGAIVTDAGSVKGEVIRRLDPIIPDGVSFVGAHPISGGESSGFESATSDLFKGALCIITPVDNTDRHALEVVSNLWRAMGSNVRYMGPEEHDLIYASVSHLPHIIAYTLVNTILDIKDGLLSYGGSGLRDMTRIAMSPAELWRDICIYNRDNILNALRSFSSSLSHVIDIIENSDWIALEKEFDRASKGRRLIESD
jgi:prephenate dehydrogenase